MDRTQGTDGLVDLRSMRTVEAEKEPANALEYCQDVYKGRRPPDAWRLRAAFAALQFETPKLLATTNMNEKDFGRLLDNAILRSLNVVKLINGGESEGS